MEIKIKDKDISVGANGYPEIVKGIDEYLQRAYIALSAVKGEFCYLRELGAFKELKSIENIMHIGENPCSLILPFKNLSYFKIIIR